MTLEEKVTLYFEQWRDPVNRYVVAAFGDPGEAEEITQEFFLQLYRSLHGGQSIANVRAWIFRTAHTMPANRIKAQQFVALVGRGGLGRGAPDLRDANRARDLLSRPTPGNIVAASGIVAGNDNIGVLVDGAVLWGEFGGIFLEGYAGAMRSSMAMVASSDPWWSWLSLGARAIKLMGWKAVVNRFVR